MQRGAGPSHSVAGCDACDARRVSAAAPVLGGGVPSTQSRVAPRWETAHRSPVCGVSELPLADAGRSAVFHPDLPEDLRPQVVQGRLFGMRQSQANPWIHILLPALLVALRTLGDAPARSLMALAQRLGVSEADAATVVAPLTAEVTSPAAAVVPASPLVPMTAPSDASSAPKPLLHRPSVRAARQKIVRETISCSVNALRTILVLRDTSGGRVHDTPMADVTLYPFPAGSRLVQDLGFLAFTLPNVAILMPTKTPRDAELTRAQQSAHQALHHRRLRIEHVHSRSYRQRPDPPVEGGRPRTGDGNLLCHP